VKQSTTQAIILKRINFGEADRIVTVLTPQGKMSMLAKGVRKPKSKLAGGLELFCVSDVTYINGRSDLKTITSTKLNLHCKTIPSEISRSMAGYEILKAMSIYSDHTDEPDMFMLTRSSFEALDDSSMPIGIVQVWFTMQLMQIIGSSINLERPLRSEVFSEQQMYSFSYDDMAFFTDVDGQFTPNSIKFLRLVQRSKTPNKLLVIDGAEGFCVDLVPLMQNLLLINRA